MENFERHPLNSNGDFFVEYDMCLACDAPYSEAPELMAYDENMHCYFKRQPETAEELEHAINAVWVSCIEAVRYEGNDPKILQKIERMNCKSRTAKQQTLGEKISNLKKAILKKINRD